MADNQNKQNEGAEFNNINEREGMQEEAQKERQVNPDAYSKTSNELSTGNSIRNFGEVNGTTFGGESNPAKFSNIGQKNQTREGEGDSNMEDVNTADKQKGSGGTMYSDYLNQAQNQFISGTGQFANNEDRTANNERSGNTKPFDAMQGNRESNSGGRSDNNEG